ncbi:hypothetical protein DPMN_023947 [Dreissena polymorpha]|uniref:Uncharacterized protein n=1 Tax=Dreissena polymorpha TaxID=45954 RepID=A0A9D4LN72_DREPO|nr:hypothetical protein DPMN_023947 [Dreissena polymorpha]
MNDGAKFIGDFPTEVSKKVSKPRRNIHKVVGGKAMTEDKTFDVVRQYIAESATRPSTAGKAMPTGSPVAGPSRAIQTCEDDSMSVDNEETDDEQCCCVSKKYYCTGLNTNFFSTSPFGLVNAEPTSPDQSFMCPDQSIIKTFIFII